ncbi:hypothetical protein DPM19_18500 [Actinomadura craniellae]|uniref:Uncharacterized protein n=1 Tax=Actinomadura craniellae TaxID=2231787 RepID=A0A365H498_9ACTN|nr:hypothetical protein [Actinomadura craniellae]RAY13838.1 hypothetical protein DPM19_18500 [Actinomadura craniellae]
MADDEEPIAIGEALAGIKVLPLLEGWTALAAIVLVKCIDEEGRPSWAFRTTDGLNDEELLGALTVRTDMLRRDLLASYYDQDE